MMGAQNDAHRHGTAPDPYLGNSSLLLFFLLASGWSLLSQAQETDQGEGGDGVQTGSAFPARMDSRNFFFEDLVWGKRMKG